MFISKLLRTSELLSFSLPRVHFNCSARLHIIRDKFALSLITYHVSLWLQVDLPFLVDHDAIGLEWELYVILLRN